jgi:hypothetical protein
MGHLDVMLATNGMELTTKHLAMSYKNRYIVAAGELRVQRSGAILFNAESGTFMNNKNPEDYKKTIEFIVQYFKLHGSKKPLYFTPDILIPVQARPSEKETDAICYSLSNRMMMADEEEDKDFFFSETEFEEIAETSELVCKQKRDVLNNLVSVKSFLPDIKVSRDKKIVKIK